jgi:hypothetical protein
MAEPHGKMRDLRCQPDDSYFQMNDIVAGKFNRRTIEI